MSMGVASSSSGRRRRGRGRRAPMAEINVTPLVDVMLVLLIIFMVTAPLLTAGVPLDLPDSRADALSQEKDQITISIADDGTVYLDESPIERGGLEAALANIPRDAEGKPPLVTLRADKALDYGRVMEVMGELSHAGFGSISLVTNSSVEAP
ncbi:biopolymer transporter TolR [Erythrobacter sp. SG61-1L]|uniref:ExbD/TolR family protein n=1 Tax=Erythrobacter sp. SG61-1L TaxID=1603897 RepID=UPI0006C92B39|nr:biopolymer transporter ExbD [Erythrobacter sp. SG61-1L]KPL68526.1 biopolymer transporter TolR [Erythrobacter sp. SG61-1L]